MVSARRKRAAVGTRQVCVWSICPQPTHWPFLKSASTFNSSVPPPLFVTAEIPDELIDRIEDHVSLPNGWQDNWPWTQEIGRTFVREEWSAALSVPSVIVADSRNIVLNPLHADFRQIIVYSPVTFTWDLRLWK
jgi:hypothetical protein